MIKEVDHRPIDPCLVYDRETGEFSIESKLTPREDTEHIVCERIGDSWLEADASKTRNEISEAVDALREKMTAAAVESAMTGMDDDYIREYIVGDLDSED